MSSTCRTVLILSLLAASPATSQWLVATIPVPDSTASDLDDVNCTTYNPRTGIIYFGGNAVLALEGGTNRRVALIPTGTTVTALCCDTTVNKIYAVVTGESTRVAVIDGETQAILTYLPLDSVSGTPVVNPVSPEVYVANPASNTVTVIDAAHDSVITAIPVGDCPVALCCNTTDGKVYSANRWSNDVTVIDCDSRRTVATITDVTEPGLLCFNAVDDRVYCTNGDETITVIDGRRDVVLSVIETDTYCRALFHHPGQDQLYCAASYDEVDIIDCRRNAVLARVEVGSHPVALAFDPSVDKAYCANVGGSGAAELSVIDCSTKRVIREFQFGSSGQRILAVDPKHSILYCIGRESPSGVIIDTRTDSIIGLLGLSDRPVALAVDSARGLVYCACSGSGVIAAVDAATNRVVSLIETDASPAAICFNPARNKLYCADASSNTLHIIDAVSGSVIRELPVGLGAFKLAYNPFNDKVYCLCEDNTLTIVHGELNGISGVLTLDPEPVDLLSATATGRVFCTTREDDRVHVIDPVTNRVSNTIEVDRPGRLQYDPLRRLVYCLSHNNAVSVIECSTATVLRTIEVRASLDMRDICLGRDGTRLYCADEDEDSVHVIALDPDTVRAGFAVGRGPASLLAVPGSDLLFCADYSDGTVTIVDASSDTVIATVRVGRGPGPSAAMREPDHVFIANTRGSSLSVLRGFVGIAEAGPAFRPEPTPAVLVRRSLRLPGPEPTALRDIAGRAVAVLTSGENDVSGLPPGVYCYRPGPGHPFRRVLICR